MSSEKQIAVIISILIMALFEKSCSFFDFWKNGRIKNHLCNPKSICNDGTQRANWICSHHLHHLFFFRWMIVDDLWLVFQFNGNECERMFLWVPFFVLTSSLSPPPFPLREGTSRIFDPVHFNPFFEIFFSKPLIESLTISKWSFRKWDFFNIPRVWDLNPYKIGWLLIF